MTFAFAAAGTGGHVYPALAVARALIDEGVEPDDVIFFGGERLEATAVPGAGFELVPIEIRGLSRSLSARNFTLPAVVARATNVVRDTLVRRGTDVLTSFGGYVGVPGGVGARRARVPLVVHEQNAVAGLANKVVSRWAATLCGASSSCSTEPRSGPMRGRGTASRANVPSSACSVGVSAPVL
jgi:UDP-N-acetylglucosamine--N-acetylmuramyl-(pentapeptide) pyrophosphoryl-undecaprenol N-acetylglucosamine transferase